jgi:hypothetical protein
MERDMTQLEQLEAIIESGFWSKATQAHLVFGWRHPLALAAFHGSLDAAKNLHDVMLPGWGYRVSPQYAIVLESGVSYGVEPKNRDATMKTPARAWLLAIVRALIAMEKLE